MNAAFAKHAVAQASESLSLRGLFPAWLLLAVLGIWPQPLRAQGGPPLLTDDPATPGNRHWEINVGFTVQRTEPRSLFELPRADFNYGWGNRIQLKFEVPWLLLKQSQTNRSGLGNSLIGVKWRFMDEEKWGVSVSTYPQLEFNNPTASVDQGLVERGTQFLLPVELARQLGPFAVDGEFGYRFVQYRSDEWLYGLALGHQLSKRLELLGEIHGTARRDFGEDVLVFDLGGRERLDRVLYLLFTAGKSLRGSPEDAPRFLAYLGIGFNF